jgi:hypothetical protein
MGIEFKLTDRELPASPAFVEFLGRRLMGDQQSSEPWFDQRSDALVPPDPELARRSAEAAEKIMASSEGRQWIGRSYQLLCALLVGEPQALAELHARFQFICIVGAPRTGGSYLTGELYRAVGLDPLRVPNALAHDAFPEAAPFDLKPGANAWIVSMKTMAEYLTMVSIFFAGCRAHAGRIVVPKKLTKSVYAGGFFAQALGGDAEYVLTLRHPAAACVSMYEKSGGLPPGGRFRVRSNIEEWCRRDLEVLGLTPSQMESMDYFDIYLRYWEQYYLAFATLAWSARRKLRALAYSVGSMEGLAASYHERFASGLSPTRFQPGVNVSQRHPDWLERAAPGIARVAAAWGAAGLDFPMEALLACS